MYILGISAFYHDSAACLIKDGEILAAAQEERFTRIKNDASFPVQAINFCLKKANISSADLSYVGFYEKPWLKFERILETYLTVAPRGFKSFVTALPLWLNQKLWTQTIIRKNLDYQKEIIFAEHHESHVASSFYPFPFSEAAFISVDGVGEWTTTSYGTAKDNRISFLKEICFPHSLGLLYSAFTYYLGFKINSDECKVMGLASYGNPVYVQLIKDKLINIKEDGSFKLNLHFFGYTHSLSMINDRFVGLFGMSARGKDDSINEKHRDIARSIQHVTEEVLIKMARHVYRETGMSDLCLSGGVALNCVANGRIARETPFKRVFIQPAAGDAGGALGAAYVVWHHYLNKKRDMNTEGSDKMNSAYLGPEFSDEAIREYLEKNSVEYEKFPEEELVGKIARLISEGKIIAWFQGRMEYGPRALGNRSILADPRPAQMREILNQKIKFRESFRPFGLSILEECYQDYLMYDCQNPYMLMATEVKEEKRKIIPAVTHVDNTTRIQTVGEKGNRLFCNLIREFFKITGVPVLLNTSFNLKGEPIVCTPNDAYTCFRKSKLEYLIMGRFVIKNEE